MNQSEIVLFQPNNSTPIEVRIEDETVWLTQAQMAELFQTTRNNVTLHIGNIFKENELKEPSVCKDSLLTANDGKKYRTKCYNLDVIISVGYRVKSLRGTQFRIWANQVLKDYLLKGYALHQRVVRLEQKLWDHDKTIEQLINTTLPPHEGIFYDDQIFDAYTFVSSLIKSAQTSILLIDNYVDESVLMLLSKRGEQVSATIFTQNVTKLLLTDLKKFNTQYPPIEIKTFTKSHDRFLIIDHKTVYHIGASLKDLGKKWFAFSKINISVGDIMEKLDANALL
jgi:hypothetical protein